MVFICCFVSYELLTSNYTTPPLTEHLRGGEEWNNNTGLYLYCYSTLNASCIVLGMHIYIYMYISIYIYIYMYISIHRYIYLR